MILIAPDKYKGTLSAYEAAQSIAEGVPYPAIIAPMADGGEGTASILCDGHRGWECREDYYYNPESSTAVIDSSAVIGLMQVDHDTHDILTATSAPLGRRIFRLLMDEGIETVIIGIGGTATCDGGIGFYHEVKDIPRIKERLIGLSDVSTPLLGALHYAPQKGAEPSELQILEKRLRALLREYPDRRSPFDGAGGGLGFAIASLIGARCVTGAAYVLQSYQINWEDISLVITGEGRIDSQTAEGKVVETIRREAERRHLPCIAIGGTVDLSYTSQNEGYQVISADTFLPGEPLTTATASRRLRLAAASIFGKQAP